MARMPKLLSLLFTFALSGVRAGATCQDDPEIELCDYKSPTGECSGDDLDLCDYKMTPSPSPSDTCSGDDLDLCDYKMTPSPSPPGAGDPSMCPPPSPPPSLSGTCSGDDLDLCDYKMSESPNSSGMCSGDDLDLCDYKQSRSMTCKDDVEVDLCDYITDPLRGKTCKNDPDVDLCDYKVGHLLTQVPVPSSPSLPSPSPLPPPPRQPCTPTPTPTESPSPTPEPVLAPTPEPAPSPTPESPAPTPSPTPEPVLAPTPEPAPSPTPESPAPTPAPEDTTKTTTVVYQVASYDAELELDDVTKFDQQKFIESLATSQATVDADEVEVESVQYVVKTSYDFPDTMDEAQVKLTIVNSQGVSADNVEVKKMEQRRLAGSRRLAAGWDVVIKTSDAAAVSAIVEKAKDKEAIKKAAEDQGIPDVTVAVKSEPKQAVEVKFKVKSEPNSADVIESIDTSKLGEELGTKLGVEVVAAVEFKGKAEEIVTPVEVEEEDADGAKALSSAVGICFVLGSIIMRM